MYVTTRRHAFAAPTDRGLFLRIEPAGLSARYENRIGENHHHLICGTCSRTVDVDCAVGDAPCLTAGDLGDEIDGARSSSGAAASAWRRPLLVGRLSSDPSEGNIERGE